jgi:alkanesulfonate monooxygenase SsuD/methylene tetrahydromethanopterin reductase-like flavin-dependent oxidoreductase (luciferase family)
LKTTVVDPGGDRSTERVISAERDRHSGGGGQKVFHGIEFPPAGECGDPKTLAELARLAEEAGWDGVFLEDYVFYHNDTYHSVPGAPTYDPWICLAAMATRTEHVRLGTAITPLPRRRPWKLAREAISLDHLSGGRLFLGVGSGDVSDNGFTHVGEETDPKRRAGLLDEGLEILAGLMGGRPFSYEGEHHTVHEVTFLPEPVRQPRIPIWVGGLWPRKGPLRRAARWDGFIPYKQSGDGRQVDLTPEDVYQIRATTERERAGSGPFDLVVGGSERREDWEEERSVISSLAEAGATWWLEWVPAAGFGEMRRAILRGPLRAG